MRQKCALCVHGPETCPDLARVAEAWAGLPEHIRAAVLALVDTAKGAGQ